MLLPNGISYYGSKAAVFTIMTWMVVEGERVWFSGVHRWCVCEKELGCNFLVVLYRIVGIFQGVKFSWVSWLRGEPRNFYA